MAQVDCLVDLDGSEGKIEFVGNSVRTSGMHMFIYRSSRFIARGDIVCRGSLSGLVSVGFIQDVTAEIHPGFRIYDNIANSAPGLCLLLNATAVVEGIVIENNIALGEPDAYGHGWSGGGVTVMDDSNLVLRNSIIRGNSAKSGGGISTDTFSQQALGSRVLVMEDVEITSNIARGGDVGGDGGGARMMSVMAEMTRVIFQNNTAAGKGGAVSFQSDSQVNVTSCSLSDNTARWHGGGWSADALYTNILATSTLLARNRALQGEGGCAYLSGTSSLSLAKVDLRSCSAGTHGGGISMRGKSTLSFADDVSICDCTTEGMGGGVLAAGESVKVNADTDMRVLVEKNRARQGGGICCMSRIAFEGQSNSVIVANEASEDGGGIFAFSSYAELVVGSDHQLVLQGNVAARDGGGICLKQGAQLTVQTPPCSSLCSNEMRGDGLCDHGCMSASCNWDNGI